MKLFRSVAMLSLSCASLLASLGCTKTPSTDSPTVQKQSGPAAEAVAPDASSIAPPTRSAEAEGGSAGARKARKIGDEEARKIALAAVPGEVTGVAIETKQGKQRIVVEVLAKDGSEVDVIIDMETGKVLGTEK